MKQFFFSRSFGREGERDEEGIQQAAREIHRAFQDTHRLHGEDQVTIQ